MHDCGDRQAGRTVLLPDGNDPLLYRERRAYLKAVQEAQSGLELARVTLAGAVRRMERP
jgi:hypothetical protein